MGERSSNYTIGNVMQAFGTVSPKNLNDDKLDSEAYFSNLSLSTVVLQTGRQGGWEQSNITSKTSSFIIRTFLGFHLSLRW